MLRLIAKRRTRRNRWNWQPIELDAQRTQENDRHRDLAAECVLILVWSSRTPDADGGHDVDVDAHSPVPTSAARTFARTWFACHAASIPLTRRRSKLRLVSTTAR